MRVWLVWVGAVVVAPVVGGCSKPALKPSTASSAEGSLIGTWATCDGAVYRFEQKADAIEGFLQEPGNRAQWGFGANELVLRLQPSGDEYAGEWKVFTAAGDPRWDPVSVRIERDELFTQPVDATCDSGWTRQ